MSWSVGIAGMPEGREAERIHAFVTASSAGHLYQYPLLDRIEEGPRIRTICGWAERDGVIGASAVARLRRVRGIGPWVARIDRGPVFEDLDALGCLLEAIGGRLRDEGAASVRVNPLRPRESDDGTASVLASLGYVPVSDDDYDSTLLVDIDRDSEALLAGFAKGTRYAIRQAMKAGVACSRAAEGADIRALESLYADMVARKGATPRPEGFFARIHEFLTRDPSRGFVLVSRYADEIVGGIVVTRYGNRALYTFGASKDADDGIPKTHLLQYEGMTAAHALGCTGYDLGGFSAGVGEDGARSPAQSINFFKSRFTKNVLAFLPCHELVLRPLLHGVLEKARRLSGGGKGTP